MRFDRLRQIQGTLKKLGLERVLSTCRHRRRDRVVAMVVARLVAPRSKLATARELDTETLSSSLAEEVGVASATADELYEAMDWLVGGQERIEKQLASRHLEDGGPTGCGPTSSFARWPTTSSST